MNKVGIVTDSTADIPDELVQQHQIHVVPNLVIIDGASLLDGKDISRSEFYTRLPLLKTTPTTSTASSGTYQSLYEKLIKDGVEAILSIHASSLLSGIFNAARIAMQTLGNIVQVIDSEQVSMGLGFQVLAAAEAIANGETLQSVVKLIESVRKRVYTVAMLDTLEYIRRSGRVSWARARLGNLLQVKPLISLKAGHVLSLGHVRTRKNGIEFLKNFIRNLGPLERLAILHTNAEVEARQILEEINVHLAFTPLIVNVTTVIGTHVGPNGLGLVAVTK